MNITTTELDLALTNTLTIETQTEDIDIWHALVALEDETDDRHGEIQRAPTTIQCGTCGRCRADIAKTLPLVPGGHLRNVRIDITVRCELSFEAFRHDMFIRKYGKRYHAFATILNTSWTCLDEERPESGTFEHIGTFDEKDNDLLAAVITGAYRYRILGFVTKMDNVFGTPTRYFGRLSFYELGG